MKTICNKTDCIGCGLCAEVCCVKCITMSTDDKGFLIPLINDENCINCNKCVESCPQNKVSKNTLENQKCFLAWHNSDNVRFSSSSGGVFTALAESVLEQNGYVIGAAYNKDFSVEHIIVSNNENLAILRKSKYLQSDITNLYHQLDLILNKNVPVLFSGTPCQCAAIKQFAKENENLILCDLICHGVQSPEFFQKALKFMENKVGGKCISLDFRSKSKGWANACTTYLEFSNNKTINKRLNDIPIGSAFLQNLSIRDCCEKCKYRSMERVGDITIGDFWAVRDNRKILKKYGDLGYSSIISNTKKGEELLNKASKYLHLEEKTEEEVKAENGPLWRAIPLNAKRNEFWQDYKTLEFEKLVQKYLKVNRYALFRWHLRKLARKTGVRNAYYKLRRIIK